MEVATLWAQMAAGGGLDEMRRLRTKVKDLRERVGFYKGRYHVVVLVDQIEHYKCLIMIGTISMCTGMGVQGESDWNV